MEYREHSRRAVWLAAESEFGDELQQLAIHHVKLVKEASDRKTTLERRMEIRDMLTQIRRRRSEIIRQFEEPKKQGVVKVESTVDKKRTEDTVEPNVLVVRKVWYYQTNEGEGFTVDEKEAASHDPGYRLATFDELMTDPGMPVFKGFPVEVEEGVFVFWEKSFNCIIPDLLGEEPYEYGYIQLELTEI